MHFLPILRPGPGVRVLETERALSESMLWELNERFFQSKGPQAWKRVPDYITTSQWNARVQADLVFGYLQDLAAAGCTEPVTVIEMAAGTGRLGVRLNGFLRRRLADSHLAELDVRIVLTDLVDANLQRARDEPGVQCVAWDVADPAPPVPLDGPVVVVANYCFDGVANDAYVVHEQELHALHAGLCTADDVDVHDPELVSAVGLFWEPTAPGPSPYEPLLDLYRREVSGTFTLPVSALAVLERVRDWSDRFLVIVADKGVHRLQDVARQDVPRIARHGSVSMPVNLHALCWWHEHSGGVALSAWHHSPGLSTVALCNEDRPLALTRAYRRWEDLDAGTFNTVRRMVRPPTTLREALSWLRLSGHEHEALAHSLLTHALDSGDIDADEVADILIRVGTVSRLEHHSEAYTRLRALRSAVDGDDSGPERVEPSEGAPDVVVVARPEHGES